MTLGKGWRNTNINMALKSYSSYHKPIAYDALKTLFDTQRRLKVGLCHNQQGASLLATSSRSPLLLSLLSSIKGDAELLSRLQGSHKSCLSLATLIIRALPPEHRCSHQSMVRRGCTPHHPVRTDLHKYSVSYGQSQTSVCTCARGNLRNLRIRISL